MQDSHAKDGFNCNLCKNTFTAYKYLVFHEDRYHSTKEFQCQVCLKLFSLPSHLKRHQKAFHFRETQFMCCKENFGTLQNMLSHEELVHKGKRWRCIQCFKVCSTQNMLDRHMKKPHREKSPCPECGLMMSPKALKCHFTLVHRTDKVPCDECNDSFVSDKSLKKHKNIRHFKIKIEE
jgi:KRAB domain-containing zinc finger protein